MQHQGQLVFCVQNLPVPGDPRVWREARDLAAAGHRVTVIAQRGPGQSKTDEIDGVSFLRYPAPPDRPGRLGQAIETVLTLAWTFWLVLRLRRRGPIAVLHAANPPDTFFLVGLGLRLSGARFVFDQHDACPELFETQTGGRGALYRTMRLLEWASYRSAHLVIAPNESYKRLAETRGGRSPNDVVVVRSGPDALLKKEWQPATGVPVIAFAGAMDPQDGVHLLIDAVAEILQRRPGAVKLDLIGAGSEVPDLKLRAARLGVADAVTWPGWLATDELHDRLATATIAVSPDDETPFTLVSTMTKVTDYLGLGLPCVVADLPENRVTGRDAVAYFRAGDVHDLAKRIEELLDDPALMAELAEQARNRAGELLWQHSRTNLLAAYERLTGTG